MNKFFNATSVTVVCITACVTAPIVVRTLDMAFPRKEPTTLDVFNSHAIDANTKDILQRSGLKLNKLIDEIEEDEDNVKVEKFPKEITVDTIIKKRQQASKIYLEIVGTLTTSMPSIIAHDYGTYSVAKEWMNSFEQAATASPTINKPLLRYKLE